MTETVHVVDERPRLGRGTAGIGNGHLIETDSR